MPSTHKIIGKNTNGFFIKEPTKDIVSLKYIAKDILITDNLSNNEYFEISSIFGSDIYPSNTLISYRLNMPTAENIVYISEDTPMYIRRVNILYGTTYKGIKELIPMPLLDIKPIQSLDEKYLISPSEYFIINEGE